VKPLASYILQLLLLHTAKPCQIFVDIVSMQTPRKLYLHKCVCVCAHKLVSNSHTGSCDLRHLPVFVIVCVCLCVCVCMRLCAAGMLKSLSPSRDTFLRGKPRRSSGPPLPTYLPACAPQSQSAASPTASLPVSQSTSLPFSFSPCVSYLTLTLIHDATHGEPIALSGPRDVLRRGPATAAAASSVTAR